MSSFLRRTGAPSDLEELEYVLALHRTAEAETTNIKSNGLSIRDVDIGLYLRSRYGIEASSEDIRSAISDGLGGAGSGDDGRSTHANDEDQDQEAGAADCRIDLAEMVSLLLIPTLCKAVPFQEEGKEDSDCEDTVPHLVQPPPDLIAKVLAIILEDVGYSPSDEKPELTASLVRDILCTYGEDELAEDDGLIEAMIGRAARVAKNKYVEDRSPTHTFLDVSAFAFALTADVIPLFDVGDEVRLRSNRQDVLAAGARLNDDDGDQDKSDRRFVDKSIGGAVTVVSGQKGEEVDDSFEVDIADISVADHDNGNFRDFPSSSAITSAIDFASCRYDSQAITLLLLLGFVLLFFSNYQLSAEGGSDVERPFTVSTIIQGILPTCLSGRGEIHFGCLVWTRIVEWFLWFQFLWAGGLIYVGLGSLGNGVDVPKKQRWTLGLAASFIGGTSWAFFLWRRGFFKERWVPVGLVIWTHLIIANVIVVLQIHLWIGDASMRHFWSNRCSGAKTRLINFLKSSGVTSEAAVKRAAAHKTNLMVNNALTAHHGESLQGDLAIGRVRTPLQTALLNFSLQAEETVEVGGVLWGWKMFFGGDLLVKEGICLSARVLAINVAQFFLCFLAIFFGIYSTRSIVDEWEAANANPLDYYLFRAVSFFDDHEALRAMGVDTMDAYCEGFADIPDLPDNFGLNNTGIQMVSQSATLCAALTSDSMKQQLEELAASFFPNSRYMVEAPLIVAFITGFLAALASAIMFLPSVISTYLKLRQGEIPFWEDTKKYFDYRQRLDLVTSVLGSMFWTGCFASVLLGAIIGGLTFLFLWQVRIDETKWSLLLIWI